MVFLHVQGRKTGLACSIITQSKHSNMQPTLLSCTSKFVALKRITSTEYRSRLSNFKGLKSWYHWCPQFPSASRFKLQNEQQLHFPHCRITTCHILIQNKSKNNYNKSGIWSSSFFHPLSFICSFAYFLLQWNLSPLHDRCANMQCNPNSNNHINMNILIIFTLTSQSAKKDYTLNQFYQLICYFLSLGLLFCHVSTMVPEIMLY